MVERETGCKQQVGLKTGQSLDHWEEVKTGTSCRQLQTAGQAKVVDSMTDWSRGSHRQCKKLWTAGLATGAISRYQDRLETGASCRQEQKDMTVYAHVLKCISKSDQRENIASDLWGDGQYNIIYLYTNRVCISRTEKVHKLFKRHTFQTCYITMSVTGKLFPCIVIYCLVSTHMGNILLYILRRIYYNSLVLFIFSSRLPRLYVFLLLLQKGQ